MVPHPGKKGSLPEETMPASDVTNLMPYGALRCGRGPDLSVVSPLADDDRLKERLKSQR